MTTPKPKARKPFTTPLVHPDDQFIEIRHRCIPLDAASVDALREKVASELGRFHEGMAPLCDWTGESNAVLAALGIKRRTTK